MAESFSQEDILNVYQDMLYIDYASKFVSDEDLLDMFKCCGFGQAMCKDNRTMVVKK